MNWNEPSPATAQYGSLVGGIEMQPDTVGSSAHENMARWEFLVNLTQQISVEQGASI